MLYGFNSPEFSDRAMFDNFITLLLRRSVVRADTIRELAAKLGVDAEGLESTVARFNRFAAEGVDQDFGRGAKRWRLAGDASFRKYDRIEKDGRWTIDELRAASATLLPAGD